MARIHRHGDEKVRRAHCGHYRQGLLLDGLHSRRATWQGLGELGGDGTTRLFSVRPHVALIRPPHVPHEKLYPGRGRAHVHGSRTRRVSEENMQSSSKRRGSSGSVHCTAGEGNRKSCPAALTVAALMLGSP